MACFSAFFWSRRKDEGALLTSSDNAPWFISGVEPHKILPPPQIISKQEYASYRSPKSFCDDLLSDLKFLSCDKKFEVNRGPSSDLSDVPVDMSKPRINYDANECVDVCDTDFKLSNTCISKCHEQVALAVLDSNLGTSLDVAIPGSEHPPSDETSPSSKSSECFARRHRRTGVFELSNDSESNSHMQQNSTPDDQDALPENSLAHDEKNVESKKGEEIPENDNENLLIPPVSGYCSSAASGGSEDEFHDSKAEIRNNLVRRCESSDSAIVHSDEETTTVHSNWGEKKEEIDELPYSYPVFSPYSPRRSIDHENVPSKTLIEAQFVPYPLDRKLSDCFSETSDLFNNDSRRQSCFTDDGEEISRYRYWRTPSVVVSDYSDDPMGLTLEDIEYIRSQQRESNSSPDSSLHSSCSNLNFFGSNAESFRKVSDCSTCSFSGDEDSEYSREVA